MGIKSMEITTNHKIVSDFYAKKSPKIDWLLVIARAVVWSGVFTIFMMLLATTFIHRATASIEYKAKLADIRYNDTRHK